MSESEGGSDHHYVEPLTYAEGLIEEIREQIDDN